MSNDMRNMMIFQNMSAAHEMTFRDYIDQNPRIIIAIVCFVVIGVSVSFIIHTKQRAKEARQAELRLQKHLNLCSLAGDIFVEYNYKKNVLTASCPVNNETSNTGLYKVDLIKLNENNENKAAIEAFVDIMKQDCTEPLEIQIPFFDGSVHWVELTIAKMRDEQNELLYSLARLRLIDEKFRAQETLRHQAERDGLTQLYNIGHCSSLIQERLSEIPGDESDALIIIDIDYFKSVNDTYGHMTGNDVLQNVANMLREHCPDTAIIGRMGGDEFIIYLVRTENPAEVENLCKNLCKQAEKIHVSEERTLSLSIGAAMIRQQMELKTALEKADIALYDVKRSGRGSCKLSM